MMLAFVFAVCFTGCKDSKDETSAPYDPLNQPVEVTDFTPQVGRWKEEAIIYGSNFGTDPSVSVKVGGKEAIVISAKGTSIYCSTPESRFEGTIEVKVGEQTVIASEKYQYEPQMVVTDLCGDVDELGEGNIVETSDHVHRRFFHQYADHENQMGDFFGRRTGAAHQSIIRHRQEIAKCKKQCLSGGNISAGNCQAVFLLMS